MPYDSVAVSAAYKRLGLAPGVSPLAARRRYRELIKESHPDKFPPGSAAQVKATQATQEINNAYQTIKHAAVHKEVPLRRPTAPTPGEKPRASNYDEYVGSYEEYVGSSTPVDRLFTGLVGAVLGFFTAVSIGSELAVVWIAVPLIGGVLGAILGVRAIEIVIRVLWWLT